MNLRQHLRALAADRAVPPDPVSAPRPSDRHSARYEGYGPGDCALLVDCVTSDRPATQRALRSAFRQHGGHLAATGAVAYLFNEVGLLTFAPDTPAAPLRRCAWQAGAEDVIVGPEGAIEVLTDPPELQAVGSRLTRAGFAPLEAEVTWRAADRVGVAGEAARELLALIERLHGLTEVRSVYTNAEIASELLA